MNGKRVKLKDGTVGVIMGTGEGKYRIRLPDGSFRWIKPEEIEQENGE